MAFVNVQIYKKSFVEPTQKVTNCQINPVITNVRSNFTSRTATMVRCDQLVNLTSKTVTNAQSCSSQSVAPCFIRVIDHLRSRI